MRTPGTIYKKLREVKYRHLINLYRKYLRRTPENCKYNYQYIFTGSDGYKHEIRLCLLHQEIPDLGSDIQLNLVDVCSEPKHSIDCNGFILRHNKEDIKKILENELQDTDLKLKKYPDICALEWVLERPALGVTIEGLQKFWFALKQKWVILNERYKK